MNWRKSSYSFANGNCVEVASWRKSSHSGPYENCVEIGDGQDLVGVRDSKLGDASPVLVFPAGAWRSFTARFTGNTT